VTVKRITSRPWVTPVRVKVHAGDVEVQVDELEGRWRPLLTLSCRDATTLGLALIRTAIEARKERAAA